jgi:CheY-like chemotaxis protein
MTRPCFLVLDREHSGTISTRKLVIESAKFNVISVYSGKEAIETSERFQKVDAVILNASIPDLPCDEVIAGLRKRLGKLPIIVVRGPGAPDCKGADHVIDSFDPIAIIELLHKLFPGAIKAIERRDDSLKAEENLDALNSRPG